MPPFQGGALDRYAISPELFADLFFSIFSKNYMPLSFPRRRESRKLNWFIYWIPHQGAG
jgi:hypothetical protein